MGMSLSCYSSNHNRPPPDVLYGKLEMGKRNRFSPKDNTRFNPSAGELKLLRWVWRELKQINHGLVTARLFEIIFNACPEVKRFFGLANVVNEKALLDERMRMHMLIMQDTVEVIINSLGGDNEQLGSMLVAFGCQHSFYTRRSFEPKYWDIFGDAFLRLMDDLPLKAFKRYRAKTVWFRFIHFLISHMQLGYAATRRKRICRRNVKDSKR